MGLVQNNHVLLPLISMALRARVVRTTGNTSHRLAHVEQDTVVSDGELQMPAWVEIQQTDEGVFLLYVDDAGLTLTDTWHETVEQAKRQAKFEFEIRESEWVETQV
jgi:hypothetical protein